MATSHIVIGNHKLKIIAWLCNHYLVIKLHINIMKKVKKG